MAQPSALARYLGDVLAERGESPEDFARRIGINFSGFYRFLRGTYRGPQQRTMEKIAAGLGMSVGELLTAVEAEDETDDPIKQAILQRVPEMREAVEGAPRAFWASIIKYTFDRAIDTARDMTELLLVAEPPVSASAEGGVSAPGDDLTAGESRSDPQLPLRKRGFGGLVFSH